MPSNEENNKHWFKCMFDFIWTQPIHISLRQMRFIHVLLIVNSQWLVWEIVDKLAALDPVQAAIAFSAIATILITAIWKGIDGLHKANGKDEN